MSLSLQNFEEKIHAIILARGREYLLRDMVKDIEQTDSGWKATVKSESSGTYQVRLFGREEFDDWDCSCPFDHGPVCKHTAAVIYAIQQVKLYEKEETEMARNHINQLGNDEKLEVLDDAIAQLPELRQFILKRYYRSIPEEGSGKS
jgi:uncharacterized Zn finger protein